MEAVLDARFLYFIHLSFIKKITRLCPRLVIISIVFLEKYSKHDQKECLDGRFFKKNVPSDLLVDLQDAFLNNLMRA